MKPDDLTIEIARALKQFTAEVEEKMDEIKKEVADEGVKLLREKSPKKTGEYAKGWARKRIGSAEVIYNRTKPQLTHLLERGHAKRGGGRTQAFPHIEPVEKQVVEEFEKRVEKVIRG